MQASQKLQSVSLWTTIVSGVVGTLVGAGVIPTADKSAIISVAGVVITFLLGSAWHAGQHAKKAA